MKRLALILLAALAFFLTATGTSHAHAELESSDPADGAVLEQAPTQVTFTFGEPLMPDFVNFVATDEQGNTIELRVTGVDGSTAIVAWPEKAPAGTWKVDYRVVSQDGHPVNGGIRFAYAGGSASPTPAPSTSAPAPSPSQTPTTPEAPTSGPTSSSPNTPQPTLEPTATSANSTLPIIIGGVVVLGAIAAAILLVVRRRPPS